MVTSQFFRFRKKLDLSFYILDNVRFYKFRSGAIVQDWSYAYKPSIERMSAVVVLTQWPVLDVCFGDDSAGNRWDYVTLSYRNNLHHMQHSLIHSIHTRLRGILISSNRASFVLHPLRRSSMMRVSEHPYRDSQTFLNKLKLLLR